MENTSPSELKKTPFTTIQRDGCREQPLSSWSGCWSGIGNHAIPPVRYTLDGNRLCVREGSRETWYTLS